MGAGRSHFVDDIDVDIEDLSRSTSPPPLEPLSAPTIVSATINLSISGISKAYSEALHAEIS